MSLADWAERYLRHRDLFERRIASLEPAPRGFTIARKDGSSIPCIVAERLDDGILAGLDGEAIVVTRNLKENVLLVAKEWKRLSRQEGLKLIFANEAKNEKWVLLPHGHAKVAEQGSLKTGLLALHEAVPEG